MGKIEILIEKKKFYEALTHTESIIDEFYKGQLLSKIVEGVTNENYMIEEEDIIDEIVQSTMKMRQNKYKTLMKINKILVNEKRYHKAVEIINLMGSSEYTKNAVNYILDKLEQNENEIPDADKLYDKLGYTASKIRVPEFQSEAMKSIIAQLSKKSQFDKAIRLLNKIKDKRAKESSLSTIVIELAMKGNIERAMLLSEKIKKSELKASAIRNIIENLNSKKINTVQQKKWVDTLIQRAETIKSDYEKNGTLRDIAIGVAKSKNIEKAMMTADKIKDPFWKDDALMHISITASKQQKYTQAEKVFNMITDERKKDRAMKTVSKNKKQQEKSI